MAEGYERDEGVEASGGVRNAAARVRDAAGEKSRDLLDRAVEQKDELKQRAAGMADDRRLQAAGRAESISQALQGAANSLRENGEPQLSSWVSQAAGQVERVVGYMQGKPADGMLHDFEDLARRNPAMFLGGTYLAGMAVGRFLRASSPKPEYASDDASLDTSPRLAQVTDGHYTESGYTEPGAAETGYAEGSFAKGGTGAARDADRLGSDAAHRSGTPAQPWTGAGVGPSVGAVDDGFGAGATEQSPYRGSSEAGDGEPGLTDRDLRETHGRDDAQRDASRGDVRGDDLTNSRRGVS